MYLNSYIFILAGLEPKLLVFKSPTQQQSCKAHEIGQFSWIPHLPNFCSCGFVVDSTVASKDNKEEKAREIPDIRIYHIS